jgi:Kelch motif
VCQFTPTLSLSDSHDISLFHISSKQYAYTSGGFTDANDWCLPLNTVERYDLEEDKWDKLPSMQFGRGDHAFVAIGTKLFALGGESKTSCSGDPGQATTPINEVEILETSEDGAVWKLIDSLPSDRFRFPAFVYQDLIYTVGGQKYYDAGCDCYRVTDQIDVYQDVQVDGKENKLSKGAIAGVSIASIVFGCILIWVLSKVFVRSGSKKETKAVAEPIHEIEATENLS